MVDLDSTSYFSLFYILFCLGFVLQSREFVGVGLSPENLLGKWIPVEDILFIQHHISKSCGCLILHLSLPFLYLLGYLYFSIIVDESFDSYEELALNFPLFNICILFSIMPLITGMLFILFFLGQNWLKREFLRCHFDILLVIK